MKYVVGYGVFAPLLLISDAAWP